MRALLCLLALVTAAPATAQETALTPDEELRCALLAGFVSSQARVKDDEIGMASMMGYWLGRYEARTGRRPEEAVTPEFIARMPAMVATLAPRCEAEAKKVGARMRELGTRLRQSAPPEGGK